MCRDQAMQYLKVVCGFLCVLILASNVWSMSRWSEARGVYDDVCYLRQAHLFQRFGLGGLDTDISRDDDRYLSSKLKEIGFPTWGDPTTAPCHTLMPTTKKLVMQYPPGTGFVLALFPQGFQVIPLYVSATVIIFGFALLAISYARSRSSIPLTAAFGCLAIYLMINPAKASYSIAPTMAACALAGFLTARLFLAEHRQHRLRLTGLVGLLIGLAVNFRLPNLFLSSGYFLFFFVSFSLSRKVETALQGILFGAAFLAGMTPTLVANAINAGSPFSTTYGGVDVTPPDISFSVIWSYLADMQFVLFVVAIAWIVLMLRWRRGTEIRQVALVTAGNLLVNLAFFMSHPVFTPYYTIPVAMLSLWSLLFASLMQPAEAVDDELVGQAIKA
jgi:4-amino-4-deoxy-L-arabinose transferase-like glycosyltransferase